MGTNVFYNMVKEYAESLVKQRPDCASADNAICAIFTNKHDVFNGVAGISSSDNTVQLSAECLAIDAMRNAGQTKARQMITLSLADFSVLQPNIDGAEKLIETDRDNEKCEIFISTNQSVKACEIAGNVHAGETGNDEFPDGFDVQENDIKSADIGMSEKTELVSDKPENNVKSSDLGAPADFSSGFDIDVTNPFYEAPAEDKEVKTISSAKADKPVNTLNMNSGNEKKTPEISKDELLKQAKKKKKIAKNIFSAKRK